MGKTLKDEFNATDAVKDKIVDTIKDAAEDVIEDAKVKADTDKDGKVSAREWFTYFLNNPSLLFVVLLGMLARPIIEFIEVGLVVEVWDWAVITSAISSLIVPLIFGWFFKQNDGHTKNILNEERSKRLEMETEKDKKICSLNDKLTSKDREMAQKDLILELKKQEIVYMEKGYVNGNHRTNLDKNFNKG